MGIIFIIKLLLVNIKKNNIIKLHIKSADAEILASNTDDKITFVAMATKDALACGAHAGNIVREVSKLAGGSGGGRPDSAMAGTKDVSNIGAAMEAVADIVKAMLK